jgi:transposase
MSARTPIPKKRLKELEKYRESKWTAIEFKRFLCIWLRAGSNMQPKEIARAVGCHVDTVRLVQRGFIAKGREAISGGKKGGRRRQLMTLGEEEAFLGGFIKAAGDASLLVVAEIKAALEKKLGRSVHKTTVYRMLKRHQWRKAMPRPVHPKQDKEAAGAFKKGGTQKR